MWAAVHGTTRRLGGGSSAGMGRWTCSSQPWEEAAAFSDGAMARQEDKQEEQFSTYGS